MQSVQLKRTEARDFSRVRLHMHYYIVTYHSILLYNMLLDRFIFEISRDCFNYLETPNIIDVNIAILLYSEIRDDVAGRYDHEALIDVINSPAKFEDMIKVFIKKYTVNNNIRRYARKAIDIYDSDRFFSQARQDVTRFG